MIGLVLLVILPMLEEEFVQADSEKQGEKEKGKQQGDDEDVGIIVRQPMKDSLAVEQDDRLIGGNRRIDRESGYVAVQG